MVTQQQKSRENRARRQRIQRLAKLLSEELERDSWGVVDPFWLKLVADSSIEHDGSEDMKNAEALSEVLGRVIQRWEVLQ